MEIPISTIPPNPDRFSKYQSSNKPQANSTRKLQEWMHELLLKKPQTHKIKIENIPVEIIYKIERLEGREGCSLQTAMLRL